MDPLSYVARQIRSAISHLSIRKPGKYSGPLSPQNSLDLLLSEMFNIPKDEKIHVNKAPYQDSILTVNDQILTQRLRSYYERK